MAFKVGGRQCLSKCLPLKNLQLDWHFCADLNSQGPQRKSDFFPANTRNVLQGVLAIISLRGFSKVIWIEEKSRTQVISRCKRYERSKENKGHPLHVALLFIDAVNMIKCSYLFALGNPQDSIDVIYHHTIDHGHHIWRGLCTKNYSTKGRGWGLWHVNRC